MSASAGCGGTESQCFGYGTLPDRSCCCYSHACFVNNYYLIGNEESDRTELPASPLLYNRASASDQRGLDRPVHRRSGKDFVCV